TLDQQHAVLGINPVHQQVLHGHPVVTHPAGHPGALEYARGSGAAADGTRTAVHRLGTVTGTLTAEAVPLHGAGEALALGRAGHVDIGAVGEDLSRQFLADLVFGRRIRVVQPQFGQVAARVDARSGVLTGHRLVDLTWTDLAVRQLHGAVAVTLRR